MNAPAQQPPADEYAAVVAQLKALEERKDALRQLLIADPSARTGNTHLAEVREIETTRTDLKELRAMHPAIVEEFTFPAKVLRVELRAIDNETGEIIGLRRAERIALKTMRIV